MKIYQVDLPPMLQNNAVVIFDDAGNCINSSLYTTADDAAKASRAAQLAALSLDAVQRATQSPDIEVIKADFRQLMANCQHKPDPVAKET